MVEVGHIRAEHASQLRLAEDEDVVQALPPHAPQEALAGRVGPQGAHGRAQDADPARGGEAVEARPVLGVVVADQESRGRPEGRRLAQLLGDPGVRRVPRHANVLHPARPERDHEERIYGPEAHVSDREEIAGPDAADVVAQERRPGLPGAPWRRGRAQVFLDRALAHPDTEFQQLAPDALGTPQPVLCRQPPDQRDSLGRDAGSGRSRGRFPPPEEAEALPMPVQHRRGAHDDQGIGPGAQSAGQEHQQPAISGRQPGTLGGAAQDDELLAQQHVLQDQCRSTPHCVACHPGDEGERGRP